MRRGVAGLAASLLLVAAGARASESDLTAKMAEMSHAKSCGFQQIACNQTKVGTIDPSDCLLFSGQYTDFWEFTGATGDHVTVDAHSTEFDTFAALLSPIGSNGTDSSDNDSGPGTDSRIEATLDASGAWEIGVANWTPYQYGAYSVTLSCGATPTCVASDTTLCLDNGRFKVEATYTSAGSGSGTAHNVKLTDDTGYFWFFNQSNVEMVVKVLNGCPLNNHFWVYAGGLTDQGVTFTVTDTLMNVSKTYTNPLGTKWVTITDSSALASCP